MAKSSATLLAAMLLVLSAMVAQIPSAAAEEPETIADLAKCWSFIETIPGCIKEITDAAEGGGQFGKIGPACCNAINHVSQDCWIDMFPFIPIVDKLLKGLCAASAPVAAVEDDADAASLLQADGQGDADYRENNNPKLTQGCWSRINRVEGCSKRVKSIISSGDSSRISIACCKAVTETSDRCSRMIFITNPAARLRVKSTCAAKLAGHAPAPGKRAGHAPAPAKHAKHAPAPAKHAKHAPAPAKHAKHAPAPAKLAGHAPAPAHAA